MWRSSFAEQTTPSSLEFYDASATVGSVPWQKADVEEQQKRYKSKSLGLDGVGQTEGRIQRGLFDDFQWSSKFSGSLRWHSQTWI